MNDQELRRQRADLEAKSDEIGRILDEGLDVLLQRNTPPMDSDHTDTDVQTSRTDAETMVINDTQMVPARLSRELEIELATSQARFYATCAKFSEAEAERQAHSANTLRLALVGAAACLVVIVYVIIELATLVWHVVRLAL